MNRKGEYKMKNDKVIEKTNISQVVKTSLLRQSIVNIMLSDEVLKIKEISGKQMHFTPIHLREYIGVLMDKQEFEKGTIEVESIEKEFLNLLSEGKVEYKLLDGFEHFRAHESNVEPQDIPSIGNHKLFLELYKDFIDRLIDKALG